MIPNIDPPPPWTPQGWSPNQLRQNAQTFEAQMPAIMESMRLANDPFPWYVFRRECSLAELLNAHLVGIPICSDPGPNKAVMILKVSITAFVTAAFANSPGCNVVYNGYAGNLVALGAPGMTTTGPKYNISIGADNSYFAFIGDPATTDRSIDFIFTSALTPGGSILSYSITSIYALYDMPFAP